MLRASILSPLYRGVRGTISPHTLINPKLVPPSITNNYSDYYKNQTTSELSLLYSTYGTSRVRIWKHSLHSSSEQDEFSEVDLKQEGGRTHLNLITEKSIETLNLKYSSSEEDYFLELELPPEGPSTRLNMISEKPKESLADWWSRHEKSTESLSSSDNSEDDFAELDLSPAGLGLHPKVKTVKQLKRSPGDLPEGEQSTHLIIEKPREYVNTSDDDDIYELNSPPEGLGMSQDLVTETPKESLKSSRRNKKKKKSKSKSSSPKKGSDSKAMEEHTGSRMENRTATGSRMENSTGRSPIRRNSNLVVIKDISREVDLNQLIEAVSQYGEIFNTAVKADSNGDNCLYVDFQTSKAKENAVDSRGVVFNRNFHIIENLCLPEKITIRISNITSDTAEPAIHMACMKCGPVERLLRTSNTSVDVVFSVKDFPSGDDTVEKLDAVCIGEGWSAEILKEHDEASDKENNTDASQTKQDVGLELSSLLDDAGKQFQLKRVLLDDLLRLHDSVLHLQNRPEC